MSSRFFGMQAGTSLDYERKKTYGPGMAILSTCPVCNGNRRFSDHRACSREMQKRHREGKI